MTNKKFKKLNLKNIKKKKQETLRTTSKLKSYSLIGKRSGLLDIKGWKRIIMDKLSPQKTMLIRMELRTGMHDEFMITSNTDSFKYLGSTYILDGEQKYFVASSKCYAMDYHQDFSLPIKRKIPVEDIKKTIQAMRIVDVENATNPATLKAFIESKVIQQVMKGQQMDEIFKKIMLWLIVSALASLIHLILYMVKSGMLNNVKIPGVN